MTTKTKTTTTSAEAQAVADYIKYLEDPDSALDQAAIEAKEAELAEAKANGEIIRVLEIHSELIRLQDPGTIGEDLREGFVKNALKWAESSNIDVEAFLGIHQISRALLKEAGFTVPRKSRGESSRTYVKGEDAVEIVDALAKKGPFTVPMAMQASGASYPMVRKLVADGVQDGKYVEATDDDGNPLPDPNWSGIGRKAAVYELA